MKKAVYYILIVIFVGIFAFSAYKIGSYYWAKHKSEQVIQEAEKYVQVDKKSDEPELITVDFDALREINSDIVAWLYCPDTQINYPVVQGSDNMFYLSHLLDGSYNVNGTVFMDYRGAADFSDPNNILYGHHMKSGAMFACLMQYKESDYYDAHPTMYLFTPDQTYRLDLLAGVVVKSDDDIYTADMTADKLAYYMNQSTFTTKTEPTETNKIVTLSTCSYEFDEARYVILTQMVPIEK